MIIIANDQATEVSERGAGNAALWLKTDELADATGWEIKPEGACFGDACFPLTADERASWLKSDDNGDWLNYSELARKVDQPVVGADGAWSLGTVPAQRASTLESGIAPDFELQGRDGETIRLSDFRGKTVLLITWASW